MYVQIFGICKLKMMHVFFHLYYIIVIFVLASIDFFITYFRRALVPALPGKSTTIRTLKSDMTEYYNNTEVFYHNTDGIAMFA